MCLDLSFDGRHTTRQIMTRCSRSRSDSLVCYPAPLLMPSRPPSLLVRDEASTEQLACGLLFRAQLFPPIAASTIFSVSPYEPDCESGAISHEMQSLRIQYGDVNGLLGVRGNRSAPSIMNDNTAVITPIALHPGGTQIPHFH